MLFRFKNFAAVSLPREDLSQRATDLSQLYFPTFAVLQFRPHRLSLSLPSPISIGTIDGLVNEEPRTALEKFEPAFVPVCSRSSPLLNPDPLSLSLFGRVYLLSDSDAFGVRCFRVSDSETFGFGALSRFFQIVRFLHFRRGNAEFAHSARFRRHTARVAPRAAPELVCAHLCFSRALAFRVWVRVQGTHTKRPNPHVRKRDSARRRRVEPLREQRAPLQPVNTPFEIQQGFCGVGEQQRPEQRSVFERAK